VGGTPVSRGYWRRPQATTQSRDGSWLRTGDVGRQDAAGNLYLTGRLKDVIIRGGYKVHPGEVETVLLQHEAVAAAAVVGRDHPALGQEIHAFVVFKPGMTAAPEDLQDLAARQLAAHKVPRRVTILAEMPTNDLGKIVKSRLP
jgi:long-chain acyl-CoA synthetase